MRPLAGGAAGKSASVGHGFGLLDQASRKTDAKWRIIIMAGGT
jgi:hypothetical protein